MKPRKFKPGDEIVWLYSPASGYGYVFRIPGKVIGFGRCRVKIEAKKANGETVQRFVTEEQLRFGGL